MTYIIMGFSAGASLSVQNQCQTDNAVKYRNDFARVYSKVNEVNEVK